MIEKKLDTLFSELTEEEVNKINDSQINTDCDLDPRIIARISEKVKSKTGVNYTYNDDKKAEKFIYMEYFIIEEGVFWDTIMEVFSR